MIHYVFHPTTILVLICLKLRNLTCTYLYTLPLKSICPPTCLLSNSMYLQVPRMWYNFCCTYIHKVLVWNIRSTFKYHWKWERILTEKWSNKLYMEVVIKHLYSPCVLQVFIFLSESSNNFTVNHCNVFLD